MNTKNRDTIWQTTNRISVRRDTVSFCLAYIQMIDLKCEKKNQKLAFDARKMAIQYSMKRKK